MTMIFVEELRAIFGRAAERAFPGEGLLLDQVEMTQSTQEKFGHYQCNTAMKWGAILKQKPREIAEKWVSAVHSEESPLIDELTIAGPGFINVSLKPAILAKQAEAILQELRDGSLSAFHSIAQKHEKVVIDFSSPNIAKEMHVGHLRSTIIGDCLARTFEFLGYDVLRLNHMGDWGTAFGMLIAYLKENHPAVLAGESETDLLQLMNWYRAAKKQFDEVPDFKKRSQLEVVSLQAKAPESMAAWKIICEISRKAYQEIYDWLDIKLTERGESFYNPFLSEVIEDLTQKRFIEISDGAKCLFLEGFVNREGDRLPFILQKSDGGYNYATTDLAAMKHRVQEEKAKRIIIVTDAGQSSHFAMLEKAARAVGYLPESIEFDHVPFGLVLGPDGKKFKTRSGETEKLIDLITAAVNQAQHILEERQVSLDPKEIQFMAKALGINAIKYADLSSNRTGDYVFSYDRMLKFEGNTAAFLMYSYVRVNGIKRKLGEAGSAHLGAILLNHPSEKALALKIDQFPEVLKQLSEELLPHRLTEYLYGLSEKFNAFFRDCRVVGDEHQASRLSLCEATAMVLSTGMRLLGLRVIDQM